MSDPARPSVSFARSEADGAAVRMSLGERPPTILVVDDDGDTNELVREVLAFHGCDAFGARGVRQAMGILLGLRMDAVITDYSMPGGDGFELVREMRASRRGVSGVPIVMVSGHDVAGDVARRAEALGVPFLGKPLDLASLLGIVSRLLRNGVAAPGDAPLGAPGAQHGA